VLPFDPKAESTYNKLQWKEGNYQQFRKKRVVGMEATKTTSTTISFGLMMEFFVAPGRISWAY
jgi:hypothetical protein